MTKLLLRASLDRTSYNSIALESVEYERLQDCVALNMLPVPERRESSYRTCREGSHCIVPVTKLNIKIQSETKWCKLLTMYLPFFFKKVSATS